MSVDALEPALHSSAFSPWVWRYCVRWCWVLLALGLCGACARNVRSAKTEDVARRMVPVPICVQRLPRTGEPGAVIALSKREYWSLLFPAFDSNAGRVETTQPNCSGRRTLDAVARRVGRSLLRADPEAAIVAPGADGFKVLWMPVESPEGEPPSGALALVRQVDGYLEVYAMGTYAGPLEGTQFVVERMGPALVVSATAEVCHGSGQSARCDATTTVHILHTGHLEAAGDFAIQRFTMGRGPRDTGQFEYRFSASAEYQDDAVVVTEFLSVKDPNHGEVRSSDLERRLVLREGKLVPSVESLWERTRKQLDAARAQRRR